MTNTRTSTIIFSAFILSACAGVQPNSTTPVPIGSGNFMLSKLGGMLTWSGSEVKADLYREAALFCEKTGKQVEPVTSTSQDSGLAQYASAEIQFRCK